MSKLIVRRYPIGIFYKQYCPSIMIRWITYSRSNLSALRKKMETKKMKDMATTVPVEVNNKWGSLKEIIIGKAH